MTLGTAPPKPDGFCWKPQDLIIEPVWHSRRIIIVSKYVVVELSTRVWQPNQRAVHLNDMFWHKTMHTTIRPNKSWRYSEHRLLHRAVNPVENGGFSLPKVLAKTIIKDRSCWYITAQLLCKTIVLPMSFIRHRYKKSQDEPNEYTSKFHLRRALQSSTAPQL